MATQEETGHSWHPGGAWKPLSSWGDAVDSQNRREASLQTGCGCSSGQEDEEGGRKNNNSSHIQLLKQDLVQPLSPGGTRTTV